MRIDRQSEQALEDFEPAAAAQRQGSLCRLGNLLGSHPAGGIRIEDAASRGNAVRRNEVLTAPTSSRLTLTGGANGSPRAFSAEVDWPSGIIRGSAPAAGSSGSSSTAST